MRKKFFISLAFFLIVCSPALASPYLWTSHNTMVTMYSSGNDGTTLPANLSTARFFCVTLEAADTEADMPELNINMSDRDSIPKFTITGGKYSYWNGDGIKTGDGTAEKFDIARSDAVMYEDHGTLIGSDYKGYVPTNDAGDWIHFFGEAETGLQGANVSWEAQDSAKAGSGTVPDFKTTSEQLEGIVPYIEYEWDNEDPAQRTGVTGFTWRFVRSDDVNTAVAAESDMTVSFRYSGEQLFEHHYPYLLSGDITAEQIMRSGLPAITIKTGETLEGHVKLTESSIPRETILRYYTGNKKEECYQWYFMWNWGYEEDKPEAHRKEFRANYGIEVPVINGKVEYKYARYKYTDLGLTILNLIAEPKYYVIGKLEIGDGDYVLVNNDIEIGKDDIYLVNYSIMGNNSTYLPLTKDIIRPVDFNYLGNRYNPRQIYVKDATGSALSGKKVTWTFPESGLNGEAVMPDFMSLEEMFSPEGFYPYIEYVSNDNYITAVKYRFVQSPDIETAYKPDMFCVMGFEQTFGTEETGYDYYSYGGIYREPEETRSSYEGNTWTFPKPISSDAIGNLGVWVFMYPNIQTWDEWKYLTDHDQSLLPENFIAYSWVLDQHLPMSRFGLIDDEELEDISGDIAESLGEDENILAVQREEVGSDSDVTDDVKDIIESGDTELVGRFKQLNIIESGTYAVKVTLPDELFDELEGAASADLGVFPITYSDIVDSGGASEMSARTLGVARTFAAADTSTSKPVTGSLLANDGKAFDTVSTKDFILTAYLKKADGENYTNYSLYLGRETASPSTPGTPNTPNTPESSGTPNNSPDSSEGSKTPESSTDTGNDDRDFTAQKIDPDIKTAITALFNSDEYEVKTLEEAGEYVTAYDENAQPNTRIVNAISGDFENFEVAGKLPAFTLNAEKPVRLILKITADSANNLPLHFFKLEGAEVSGKSLRYVKFASNPDTEEDKDAVFFDESGKETKTLSSKTVYVSAVFGNGSYAPLAVTGTEKTDDDNNGKSSNGPGTSSSGCDSGLFGIGGALILLILPLKRKSR